MTHIIANPGYDVSFKFMMQGQDAAKHFLGHILQMEIKELQGRIGEEKVTEIKEFNLRLSDMLWLIILSVAKLRVKLRW